MVFPQPGTREPQHEPEHNAQNPLLRQLWTEAAERLGEPGPGADAPGGGSPALPAADNPH